MRRIDEFSRRANPAAFCVLITLAVCYSGAAAANGRSPAGWRVGFGLAPLVNPVFEGADDYGFSIFPDLRFQYRDSFFASVPEGIRYRVVNRPDLKAGPIARIRFGREEDDGGSPFLITGSADGLDGLGDVDTAAELGGFVSYEINMWRARFELRRGFGGHEGVVGDVSLDYTGATRGWRYAFGPRMRFGSSDFVDTYFGVDAVQASRSGLPESDADGGVNSVGFGMSAIIPQGRRMTLLLFSSYDRLLGDIADSPLVERRGNANQMTVGASLSWRFDFGGGRQRH
ncbi:MAG: MipA/OmpV family protein [Gammaproteobacteria bacterium]|jgi:outer membrane scaffolding protein for murein synthesis (MipA/OmpV family)